MRPPRYKFPDEVRTATRTMASRMIDDGAVARTPEELETWIAETPDVREALESGGYSTAFTSHDLFPLFQAFVAKAEGPPPEADAPARSFKHGWLVGLLIVVVIGLLVLALAAYALP
jgi:hypothetical protein